MGGGYDRQAWRDLVRSLPACDPTLISWGWAHSAAAGCVYSAIEQVDSPKCEHPAMRDFEQPGQTACVDGCARILAIYREVFCFIIAAYVETAAPQLVKGARWQEQGSSVDAIVLIHVHRPAELSYR